MNNFDAYIQSILEETYFGGSPYERITRVKRHITFEESEEESPPVDDEEENMEDIIRSTRAAQDKQIEDIFGPGEKDKAESHEDPSLDRESSTKGQIRDIISNDEFLSKIHVEEGENRTRTAGEESEEHIYDKFKSVDLERVDDERSHGFWSVDRIGSPVYELKETDRDKLPKATLADGRELTFTILAFPYKYVDPEDELRLFDEDGEEMSDRLAMWQIIAVHPVVNGDIYTNMRPIYVGPSTSFKKFHELMNLD
jgi:hypothetical protein